MVIQKPNLQKPKKDIILMGVLGLILVNLVFLFAAAVSAFVTTKSLYPGFWVFVDGIAIVGTLYLIRSSVRARKAAILEFNRKQKETIEQLRIEEEKGFDDGSVKKDIQ